MRRDRSFRSRGISGHFLEEVVLQWMMAGGEEEKGHLSRG